jgi:hypothetical protein
MADGGWRMADGGWRMAEGGYRTTVNTIRTESIGQVPTNADLIVVQFTDLRHPPSAIQNLNAPDLQ